MWGYRFICSLSYRERTWQRFSDTAPYWNKHRKAHQPEFVAQGFFKKYNRSPKQHKLYKFYWNIHPTERI